jgi:hypothetical protein
VLLMSHWLDTLTAEWPVHSDLVRQWVGQVLLGAVNHEQSKRLSFSSLEWLIGPAIRSLNHQRHLLGELAGVEHSRSMLERLHRLHRDRPSTRSNIRRLFRRLVWEANQARRAAGVAMVPVTG